MLDGDNTFVLHTYANDTYLCVTYTNNDFDSTTYNSLLVDGTYKAQSTNIMDKASEIVGFNNRIGANKGLFIRVPNSIANSTSALNKYFKVNPHIVYYRLATPIYTPIENIDINIPIPLRSLPNNVADTIEGNKLIQRVEKLVIDGSKVDSVSSIKEKTVLIKVNVTSKSKDGDNIVNGICDKLPYKANYSALDEPGFYLEKQGKVLYARINISEYGDTYEVVKSNLTAKPLTVYYELAEPVAHDLIIPSIYTEKGTNIITTSNNIKPQVSMKVKVK